MSRQETTLKKRSNRLRRTRAKLHGTASRPRLSVHISHRHVRAQLIDDDTGRTLMAKSSLAETAKKPLSEKAATVGSQLAVSAKKAGIKSAVFDRRHKKYHGRVKALADSARQGGLKI